MSAGQESRVEGIEKSQARYPWVDIADLHIFLLGFEAGEESNTLDRTLPEPGTAYTPPKPSEYSQPSESSLCSVAL
jgi:hypothetical protein